MAFFTKIKLYYEVLSQELKDDFNWYFELLTSVQLFIIVIVSAFMYYYPIYFILICIIFSIKYVLLMIDIYNSNNDYIDVYNDICNWLIKVSKNIWSKCTIQYFLYKKDIFFLDLDDKIEKKVEDFWETGVIFYWRKWRIVRWWRRYAPWIFSSFYRKDLNSRFRVIIYFWNYDSHKVYNIKNKIIFLLKDQKNIFLHIYFLIYFYFYGFYKKINWLYIFCSMSFFYVLDLFYQFILSLKYIIEDYYWYYNQILIIKCMNLKLYWVNWKLNLFFVFSLRYSYGLFLNKFFLFFCFIYYICLVCLKTNFGLLVFKFCILYFFYICFKKLYFYLKNYIKYRVLDISLIRMWNLFVDIMTFRYFLLFLNSDDEFNLDLCEWCYILLDRYENYLSGYYFNSTKIYCSSMWLNYFNIDSIFFYLDVVDLTLDEFLEYIYEYKYIHSYYTYLQDKGLILNIFHRSNILLNPKLENIRSKEEEGLKSGFYNKLISCDLCKYYYSKIIKNNKKIIKN